MFLLYWISCGGCVPLADSTGFPGRAEKILVQGGNDERRERPTEQDELWPNQDPPYGNCTPLLQSEQDMIYLALR